MGRIRVLDDRLIDRIAAGEVVERPASVVKELVENALDSGAGRIAIGLVGGGKRRIEVDDDGAGMDRDDALLAVERHATSKLATSADLQSIRSLGFRGEALSSIASVSRFTLSTACADGAGTEVEVHGGRLAAVRETARGRGTAVRVERLFFNVPARRKFLRTDGTELSHVVRVVTRLALAHPATGLRLVSDQRELLRSDPARSAEERIGQIFGRELVERLLPFSADEPGLRLHGLAGRPTDALPRSRAQHVFVNGRAIQDRTLAHAVAEAYGNTMPRGRHPALFLFIEIDPAQVDVNVHPQKHEVRFRSSRQVHDLVRDALRAALSHTAVVPDLQDLRPAPGGSARAGVARATLDYLRRHEGRPEPPGETDRGPASGARARAASVPAESLAEPRVKRALDAPPVAEQPRLPDATSADAPAPRALAQYRESYILAQDAEGLLLVDQHAAHERVLFERFLEEAELNRVEVQKLLFPVTCELAPEEVVLLEEEAEEFRRLGFQVEPFGGNTVRVDGVPAVAAEVDAADLLAELVGETRRTRSAPASSEPLRHRLVTSAACQAAIKINHPLGIPACQALLDDLARTVNPGTCPHGRPVVFRLSLVEIERAFDRR
jgi:DNA mismatch repair protein MutL